ncbi:hypothetical protein K9N68_19345 [Kovacikia minuta CCNUW1]|uniref:hypothetical protein n=1 Tax=Kovacikia minuta TaxID=2931930 RepID=UPI001CC9336D|nr:hypothetical protein [Kovacikia minuta]UBF23902.1 hypothetical protein K9N68_19345 [Kovacikia minuta CCNUW1]
MDTLQKQINILSAKVDALYQLIEQMSDKVANVASECRFGSDQIQRLESGAMNSARSNHGYSSLDAALEHKDVLVDNNSVDSTGQSGEKQLTSEVQIQRLTAQLTAAYNRIAALEEQLLSKRVH